MSRSLILAMDGSTGPCSVALLELVAGSVRDACEPRLLSVREVKDKRAHARRLLCLADEALGRNGSTPASLRAVVVGTGPGTFTGVRVTVATARGIGLALGVPVLGVSTLSSLVASAVASMPAGASEEPCRAETLLVPIVDARRGQVFFALYEQVGAGSEASWRRRGRPGACEPESLLETIRESTPAEPGCDPKVSLVGDSSLLSRVPQVQGVEMVATDVSAEWLLMGQSRLDEPDGVFGGKGLLMWLCRTMGQAEPWSARDASAGSFGTPESVVPIYVRAPDADLHIAKMRDPWGERVSGGRNGGPGRASRP